MQEALITWIGRDMVMEAAVEQEEVQLLDVWRAYLEAAVGPEQILYLYPRNARRCLVYEIWPIHPLPKIEYCQRTWYVECPSRVSH